MVKNNEVLYVVRFLPSNVLFLIAPMRSIQVVLMLHVDAVRRAEREAEENEGCTLHNCRTHGTVHVAYLGQVWQTLGE